MPFSPFNKGSLNLSRTLRSGHTARRWERDLPQHAGRVIVQGSREVGVVAAEDPLQELPGHREPRDEPVGSFEDVGEGLADLRSDIAGDLGDPVEVVVVPVQVGHQASISASRAATSVAVVARKATSNGSGAHAR